MRCIPVLVIGISIFAFLGCQGCGSPDTPLENVSGVNIPITLDALRDLDGSDEYKLEISHERKSDASLKCHSGACILILPLVLVSMAMVEEYDEGQLTFADGTRYVLRYDVDGNLFEGILEGKRMKRHLARLELKKLNRRFIAEIGREPRGLSIQKVPLLPQVNLVQLYEKALAATSDYLDGGELLTEAVVVLGREADGLIKKQMQQKKVKDQGFAYLVREVCKTYGNAKVDDCNRIIEIAGQEKPGVFTSLEALRQLGDNALASSQSQPFIKGYFDGLCRDLQGVYEWKQWYKKLGPYVDDAAIEKCHDPEARTLLTIAAGKEVSRERIVKTSNLTVRDTFLATMDVSRKEQRLAMLELFQKDREHMEDYLKRLDRQLASPDAEETAALFNLYVANTRPGKTEAMFGMADDRANAQAATLKWIMAATGDYPSLVKRAISLHQKNEGTVQTELAMLLLALGQHRYATTVAGAHSDEPPSEIPASFDRVENLDELILYTLKQKGCTSSEITTAIQNAHRTTPQPPPICKSLI